MKKVLSLILIAGIFVVVFIGFSTTQAEAQKVKWNDIFYDWDSDLGEKTWVCAGIGDCCCTVITQPIN